MTPFSHILPAVNVAPPQGEQDPAGSSDESKNLSGLFEKMIAQLSPETTQKEQSQPPQTAVQAKEVPQNFSNKTPGYITTPLQAAVILNSAEAVRASLSSETKTASSISTDSKTSTSAGKVSSKDKNSQTSAEASNAVANPETFLNQIFAVPVLTVDPIGKFSGKKTSEGSAAPSQAGVSELSTVLPAPARTNPVSATTAKVPQPSAGQLTPTIEASTAAQQTNASKETALPANNTGATSSLQTNPTAAMALKSSGAGLPENQTAIDSADLGAISDAGNATAKVSDSNSGAGALPQPDANGTSIAKQNMAMKQAEKTNKIAGQMEKVLPGNAVSASRENPASGISLNPQSFMATASVGSPTASNVDGISSAPADSVAASAVVDARINSLERTQNLVLVSAVRLSDSGNNSMQVVIKPDAGTQLSLELRQQGGNVEVQAALQQGDFNHLNQQWPDLQQRLEERGIRLAPLTDEGASGSNNGGSEAFQNKQNQTNQVVPELTLVNSPAGMFTSESAQTSAHRGWETWA